MLVCCIFMCISACFCPCLLFQSIPLVLQLVMLLDRLQHALPLL